MTELPTWTATELVWMRALLGVAVLAWPVVILTDPTTPTGLLRWAPWLVRVRTSTVARFGPGLVVLFVAQLWSPASSVLLAIWMVAALTVANSDGAVNHGNHLAVTAVCCYAAADLAVWMTEQFDLGWAVDASTGPSWTIQATVALYMTSGVAKVVNSGGAWIARGPNLQVSIVAKQQELGGDASSAGFVGSLVANRSVVATAAMTAGLMIELFAPLGLVHPVALGVVGIALIALHVANGAFLGLGFAQNQWIIASHLVVFSFSTIL